MVETTQAAVVRRRRRSATEWAALVEEFTGSGETAESFCERHDLGLHMFTRNQHRIRREREGVAARPRANFVEATPRARSSEGLVIEVGEGLRLRCPPSMAVDSVAQLIRALARGA